MTKIVKVRGSLGLARYRARRILLHAIARVRRRRLTLGQSLLIVAPHPDDETFGTGYLLAASVAAGCSVSVVFLTSGNASHRKCCAIDETELASRREVTARRVARLFGVPESNLHFLRLRDGELPKRGDAAFESGCRKLSDVMACVRPTQVFTTGPFESWPDHLAAEQMTRRAMELCDANTEMYHYFVWSWVKLPVHELGRADWVNAQVFDAPGGDQKGQAIRLYLNDLAPCGRPYCGKLAPEFLAAFDFDRELFFRVPQPARRLLRREAI